VNDPHAFNALVAPTEWSELRYKIQQSVYEAVEVARRADEEYGQLFGRRWGLVESYCMEGAEVALVTSSTITSTARDVIDAMRGEGHSDRLVKVRRVPPLPRERRGQGVAGSEKDRRPGPQSHLGQCGVFGERDQSALYNTPVCGFGMFDFVLGPGRPRRNPGDHREALSRDRWPLHDVPAEGHYLDRSKAMSEQHCWDTARTIRCLNKSCCCRARRLPGLWRFAAMRYALKAAGRPDDGDHPGVLLVHHCRPVPLFFVRDADLSHGF